MWHKSKIMQWFSNFESTRKKLLSKAPPGPLQDFLSAPFPALDSKFAEIPIVSVDFETTGLNSQTDKLLSVGFVKMHHRHISLADSYHQVINTQHDLKADNVLIHQITDDMKAQGQPLQMVVEDLLKALTGKVMLVHYKAIEQNFLAQACQELYGMAPVMPIIDTFELGKRKLDQSNTPYPPSALRLPSLRKQYNLPEHFGHNALNDAIATAELLLAQVAHMDSNNEMTLRDLIC